MFFQLDGTLDLSQMVSDGQAPEAIIATIVAVGDRILPLGLPLLAIFVVLAFIKLEWLQVFVVPKPVPGVLYSSLGGAKTSRMTQPLEPAITLCSTFPGVRQKDPFSTCICLPF